MTEPDVRQMVFAAASEQTAMAARRHLVSELATSLLKLAQLQRVFGHLLGPGRIDGTSPTGNGDDGVVALGYLCQTAEALISGARMLLDAGNIYGATALIRQLYELEQLAWVLANDSAEAAAWLRASDDELRRRFQPRHLRARSGGRFDAAEYGDHCELGGHPNPTGSRHLLNASSEPGTGIVELTWVELANHGSSAWKHLTTAIGLFPLTKIPADFMTGAAGAYDAWVAVDRMRQFMIANPVPI
jgi:hypothetical protein